MEMNTNDGLVWTTWGCWQRAQEWNRGQRQRAEGEREGRRTTGEAEDTILMEKRTTQQGNLSKEHCRGTVGDGRTEDNVEVVANGTVVEIRAEVTAIAVGA